MQKFSKATLVALALVSLPSFADEGTGKIDYKRINGLFKAVAEEVLKGGYDTILYQPDGTVKHGPAPGEQVFDDGQPVIERLEAGFDPKFTDLDKKRVGIYAETAVRRTIWSRQPSSTGVSVLYHTLKPVKEGDEPVAYSIATLSLNTDTARLVKYVIDREMKKDNPCSDAALDRKSDAEEREFEASACQELAQMAVIPHIGRFVELSVEVLKKRLAYLDSKIARLKANADKYELKSTEDERRITAIIRDNIESGYTTDSRSPLAEHSVMGYKMVDGKMVSEITGTKTSRRVLGTHFMYMEPIPVYGKTALQGVQFELQPQTVSLTLEISSPEANGFFDLARDEIRRYLAALGRDDSDPEKQAIKESMRSILKDAVHAAKDVILLGEKKF